MRLDQLPISRFRRHLSVLSIVLLLIGCAGGSGARSQRHQPQVTPKQEAAQLQVGLAQGYMAQGELEIALEKLQKALELDPRSAEAHTVIALLYERINQAGRAEKHYRKSIDLAPEKGAMLNNYGAYLCRCKRYDEADAMFRRALDDPFYRTPAAALTNAGVCALQAAHAEAAEKFFRQALDIEPKNPTALQELARLQYDKGDFLRARGFMQRFEGAGNPATASSLDLAAKIEEQLGDKAAARQYKVRLESDFPDYQPVAGERVNKQ